MFRAISVPGAHEAPDAGAMLREALAECLACIAFGFYDE
jgi:hypothetical protein